MQFPKAPASVLLLHADCVKSLRPDPVHNDFVACALSSACGLKDGLGYYARSSPANRSPFSEGEGLDARSGCTIVDGVRCVRRRWVRGVHHAPNHLTHVLSLPPNMQNALSFRDLQRREHYVRTL
jgi:hypothetical protein